MAVNRDNLRQRIAESGVVIIRYTGCKAAGITFPGGVSGKGYQFSKNSPVAPVLECDASSLLSLNVFERYIE